MVRLLYGDDALRWLFTSALLRAGATDFEYKKALEYRGAEPEAQFGILLCTQPCSRAGTETEAKHALGA
jgi:hypothetical protein